MLRNMLRLKMLKKDFLRKKIITVAVFIFIMLSAALMASGANMFIELSNSLTHLFEKSNAAHFVQYHAGEFEQADIDEWVLGNELIKGQQTAVSINIHESNVYFKDSPTPEEAGVMEMGFVKQNDSFDFLLDLQNQLIEVADGQIGVPIYYMQNREMQIGDTVRIQNDQMQLEFTVVSFVRDVQMNPSIISSKRFVVSDHDFEALKENFGVIEYQIGFQLNDLSQLTEFGSAYKLSSLPQKGPPIDYDLLKTLNALTDGLIAAVIIFISLLLNVVALLCLRFTILATIEEDYKEIGVMKAIGIPQPDIKKIYLSKYVVMAAGAVATGYILSLFLSKLFSANMMLYIGSAPKNSVHLIAPFLAASLIFFIVLFYCLLTLRRFDRITAVQALRLGNTGETYSGKSLFPLHKNDRFNVNIFLGLRDVFLRFRLYTLLFFVFLVCTFIIIVPLNLLNTLQSPEFVAYMGLGSSDILIDLRQTDDIIERFDNVSTYLANDADVERFSPLITSKFQVLNADGYAESLSVETGDFTTFPLEYLEGAAPVKENEIALSYLSADELDKSVGQNIQLIVGGQIKEMVVTGIYQDITDGGRTAKSPMPPDHETAAWYRISLDVGSDTDEKIEEYAAAFFPAKITNIEGYLDQTFAGTTDQLKLLTIVAIAVAVVVAILITSLFLKMLIAKDMSQIAIMKGLGFSLQNIQLQYVTRALLILNSGIILGTIFSNTLGQNLIGAVLSIVGAPNIEFIINPFHAYILSPIALMLVVTLTTWLSIVSMKDFNISDMTSE
ncbi:FtsX-like permease family protein [Candidatus Leptofilum sp.]|uniref:ABC transporter permease n=1 Tax=Candidatus Leptofilum sp. TaxID=3241576 RepID=UPI003B598C16